MNSKGELTTCIAGEGSPIELVNKLYQGISTQDKLGKRLFGLAKNNKTFIYTGGQPIHTGYFIPSKVPLSKIPDFITNSLLKEFQFISIEMTQSLK
jgi:hypothetical protein